MLSLRLSLPFSGFWDGESDHRKDEILDVLAYFFSICSLICLIFFSMLAILVLRVGDSIVVDSPFFLTASISTSSMLNGSEQDTAFFIPRLFPINSGGSYSSSLEIKVSVLGQEDSWGVIKAIISFTSTILGLLLL